MATNNFITNTASLKATTADIRKLDAKKINAQTIFLDGENIKDIIDNAIPTIKHANDTRENVYENDLWGQWVETTDDGTIVVHDDYLNNPNGDSAWLSNVKAVQNNKAYSEITTDSDGNFTGVVEDSVLANIQTDMIKDASFIFNNTPLTSFGGDLSNLVNGYWMFCNTPLTSFSGDLSSLVNGYGMFSYNGKFESFSGDLSSLTNGSWMFYNTSLESFSGNLSSLVNGYRMFDSTDITSFSGDLSNLVNGSYMFSSTPLTSFNGDLSSLIDGSSMFYSTALTSFNGDLSSLIDGSSMFASNASLTSFNGDLSNLVNGYQMFYYTSLESFSSDLSNLVNGSHMFAYIYLKSFSGNLSNLVNGHSMFIHTSLTSFNGDLSNLVYGSSMFAYASLTSFNGDLNNLVYGSGMFSNSSLTSFSGDLSKLIHGTDMFYACKLTPQSVMYIVESIRNITEEKTKYTNGEIPWVTYDSETQKYSDHFGFMEDGRYVYTYNDPNPYTTTIPSSSVGLLTLGINVTNNSSTIQQQLQTFAEGCLCDSWAELKQEFVDKGWTVTFQYGGTTDSITYSLRDGEQIVPCPIFAKLIQVEDKDSAQYCTEDASTFYNIEWYHDSNTNNEGYDYFESLEEAISTYGVIPKD